MGTFSQGPRAVERGAIDILSAGSLMCVLSSLYYVICGGGGEWEYKVTYVGRLVMSGIYYCQSVYVAG